VCFVCIRTPPFSPQNQHAWSFYVPNGFAKEAFNWSLTGADAIAGLDSWSRSRMLDWFARSVIDFTLTPAHQMSHRATNPQDLQALGSFQQIESSTMLMETAPRSSGIEAQQSTL
jgi:hypothetical protein